MRLIPKKMLPKIPELYETSESPQDVIRVYLKFFNPLGNQTWYLTEYNRENRIGFGYIVGQFNNEMGYFSITELENVILPGGLKIERDLWWDSNTTLKSVIDRQQ